MRQVSALLAKYAGAEPELQVLLHRCARIPTEGWLSTSAFARSTGTVSRAVQREKENPERFNLEVCAN